MANKNVDTDWEEDTEAAPSPAPKEAARATAGDDWQEDPDWKEEAPAAGGKKSFLGISYDPEKNDFKNKGVLSTIGKEFTKTPDPSAKAMFETLGYPGGLVSDAGAELLSRAFGSGGLGKSEWVNALKGHAKGAPEHLKDAGYGKLVQYGVGLPYAALTDPLGGFIGSRGMEEAASPSLAQAATQTRPGVGEVEAAGQPVSSLLQKAARTLYGAPFKKADAEVVSKFKNGTRAGSKPFSDQLWNEGNPLVGGFSKSNPEIGEQITNLRKETGQDIGNRIREAGGDEEVHLAPELENNIRKEIEESIPEPKLSEKEMEGISLLPPESQAQAKAIMTQAAKAEAVKQVDPGTWLKNLLGSKNKESRSQAIRILADSAPDLAGVIEDNAKHLANSGSRDGILSFYNGLIDDMVEGPRSLEGLQDLKISMQNAAARNQQMGANQYARNALPNAAKTAEMHAAEQVGKVIDQIIDESLGSSAASSADKARYSALRRGELPAWRAIQTQQSRPALSKLDLLLGLGGAAGAAEATHSPGTIAALAAAKGVDELRKSPRFATGSGMALNRAAQSNIWDNMLRRGMLNSALQKQGGNQ